MPNFGVRIAESGPRVRTAPGISLAMNGAVVVMSERKVLVVEADPDERRRLVSLLLSWDYVPVAVASAEEALALVGRSRFAFSLLALHLPGLSGIELLQQAPALKDSPIIMVAAGEHGPESVEAIQAGADDVIHRPHSARDLEDAIKVTAGRPAPRLVDESHERLERELALLVSPPMRELQDIIEQAASTDVTTLIVGETGVGKELLARAIHARSLRRRAPFVKVSCAAIPLPLLESELFGHERGAFTGAQQRKPGRFETADGGSIFLDEIGELPSIVQAKLLHVLQDGEFSRVGGEHDLAVDVRVICATNRDLAAEVAAGRFREDLYYRLKVITLAVPPLRERHDEIPGFVRYFIQRYAVLFGFPPPEVSPEHMRALVQYRWPGNVRELENFAKRMVVLQDATLPRTLLANRWPARPTGPVPEPAARELSLKEISRRAVQEAEREVIRRALEQCRWNRVKAARMLKISYRALLYKIKDMNLRQDSAAS
jgi:DNA-binding NtrC family response regulator